MTLTSARSGSATVPRPGSRLGARGPRSDQVDPSPVPNRRGPRMGPPRGAIAPTPAIATIDRAGSTTARRGRPHRPPAPTPRHRAWPTRARASSPSSADSSPWHTSTAQATREFGSAGTRVLGEQERDHDQYDDRERHRPPSLTVALRNVHTSLRVTSGRGRHVEGECAQACSGWAISSRSAPCAAPEPARPPPRPRRMNAVPTATTAPAIGPTMYTQ